MLNNDYFPQIHRTKFHSDLVSCNNCSQTMIVSAGETFVALHYLVRLSGISVFVVSTRRNSQQHHN